MEPIFFQNQAEFRNWLKQNHDKENELLVGFYKAGSGRQNMTWSQSVDVALCFGWIDGVRRSIDGESYCIRFTPRRPGSNWSDVNIKKVEELTAAGLMHPPGIERFNSRKSVGSGIGSYENKPMGLPSEMELQFGENTKAREFFEEQAPSYRKMICRWIMDAKKEETRQRRLEKAIAASEKGIKIF